MSKKQVFYETGRLLRMVQSNQRLLIAVLVIGGASGAGVPFLQIYFSAQILNGLAAGSVEQAGAAVAALLGGTVLLRAVSRGCTQLVEVWRQNCGNTIRRKLVDKVMRIAYDKYEQPSTLDEIGKIQNGETGNGGIEDQLNSVYRLLQYLFQCMFSLVFLGGMIGQVAVLAGRHSAAFLAAGFALILSGIAVMRLQVRNNQKGQERIFQIRKKNDHSNRVYLYYKNLVLDYRIGQDVRIYQMADMLLQKTKENIRKLDPLEWGTVMGKTGVKNISLGTLLSFLSYAYVAVCARAGIFPVGNVLLYASSVERFTDAVQQFLSEYSQYCYRFAYLKSYSDFLGSSDMLYDGTLPVEKRDDGEYEFELKDVSFSYPGTDQKALDHINLKFTVGKHYALVGQNGSGKSTLIALLCRLYEPTEGQILLNGIPIGLYDYQEYTDIFSVVFQDYQLFAAPVSENVAGGSEVDPEKLHKSLAEAGVLQRVEQMKEKENTWLYHEIEDGVELSGGEAQKLAMARALYKDAPFVILDEPTAALDPVAEAEVYETFHDITKGKTAVYISHRMSSCRFCDEILVLDHGKLCERGTHQQLVEQQGIYAKLYETQAEYYRKET